jgi:hypothetical protein
VDDKATIQATGGLYRHSMKTNSARVFLTSFLHVIMLQKSGFCKSVTKSVTFPTKNASFLHSKKRLSVISHVTSHNASHLSLSVYCLHLCQSFLMSEIFSLPELSHVGDFFLA